MVKNNYLSIFIVLIYSVMGCNKSIHKHSDWFCSCENKKDYRPTTNTHYIILKLENGDSLCSSGWKIDAKMNYKKHINGILSIYYPNDSLRTRVPIKNGSPNGESITFWIDGTLLSKATYVDGDIYGECIEYYTNGSISKRSYYYKSLAVGKWFYYDSLNNLIREEVHGQFPRGNKIK